MPCIMGCTITWSCYITLCSLRASSPLQPELSTESNYCLTDEAIRSPTFETMGGTVQLSCWSSPSRRPSPRCWTTRTASDATSTRHLIRSTFPHLCGYGILLSTFVAAQFAPSRPRVQNDVWLFNNAVVQHAHHNAMSAAMPNGGFDTLAQFWIAASHGVLVSGQGQQHTWWAAVQMTPKAWDAHLWKEANRMCARPFPCG